MTHNPDAPVDWETVYREQLPRLFNFFRYRTGDDAAAEDLTAITLTRAWRFREQYRSDLGAFSTWLFSIARNVAVDHLRRQKPPALPLDTAFSLAGEQDVERDVLQRQESARLMAAVRQMPARTQELIALKYGAGMNNREIAHATGLGESNVGTILHRALKQLRTTLEEDAYAPSR